MIYASMRDAIAFQQLISKASLASVLQAASLAQRLLSPTGRGQSLRRVFSRHAFSPGHRRAGEGCWRGRGRAAQKQRCYVTRHATAHPLLPSIVFGTMPHVAAYGILLVQAMFFFLGGRSGSAAITMR